MGFSLEKVSEEIRKKLKIAERLKHESLTVNAEIYDWVTSILTGQKQLHYLQVLRTLKGKHSTFKTE